MGTAACALAPNIWSLVLFRIVASAWHRGRVGRPAPRWSRRSFQRSAASTRARCCTRRRRLGLFLATFIVYQIQGVYSAATPGESPGAMCSCRDSSPRLSPSVVRLMIKEPERWKHAIERARPGTIRELFSPAYRALTFSGASMAMINLLMWWSVNAFIPVVAVGLANRASAGASAINATVAGGAVEGAGDQRVRCGRADRRAADDSRGETTSGAATMFIVYFLGGGLSIMAAFGLPLSPQMRLYMYFPIGATVWGITASFAFYLPELFPTRLRGTGAGFCFNLGRFVAAVGPFVVGGIAARGANALDSAMQALFYCGWIPIIGLRLMPWVIETRGPRAAGLEVLKILFVFQADIIQQLGVRHDVLVQLHGPRRRVGLLDRGRVISISSWP